MCHSLSLQSTVAAASEQISCDLAGEAVILNLRDSIYYGLDPVGNSIWNLLQQPRTVEAVRDAVLKEYDVDVVRCEQDLFKLLSKLVDRGLVEVRDAST